MFKKFVTIILSVFSLYAMQAQTTQTPGWKYHSINNIGLLEGQAGSAFQLQTIHGVQYKSWFAGAGIGIDYYKFRGVPLFVDCRKAFSLSKNIFFVYGDIGIHCNWMTDKQKNNNSYFPGGDFRNSIYTDAGIGYEIGISKKGALLISAGYSYKALNETYTDYTPLAYDGPPSLSNNHYGLRRLTIKTGWKF
jgi:hypothetical protein